MIKIKLILFLLQYFEKYGPSFELETPESNRRDDNSDEDIKFLIRHINGLCILHNK